MAVLSSEDKTLVEEDDVIGARAMPDLMARLSINESSASSDHQKMNLLPEMEKVKQIFQRAYNETVHYLISELQKRDRDIQHLRKTSWEEIQKKQKDVSRLERELYLISNVLDGYRRALRETQKAFSDLRAHAHRNAGPAAEMEQKMKEEAEEEEEDSCQVIGSSKGKPDQIHARRKDAQVKGIGKKNLPQPVRDLEPDVEENRAAWPELATKPKEESQGINSRRNQMRNAKLGRQNQHQRTSEEVTEVAAVPPRGKKFW